MKDFKESVKRGVMFAFIPHQLEIDGRPELSIFPLNVLFGQYKNTAEGRTILGNALYEPDFGSFRTRGKKCSMTYCNAYGGDSHLVIKYDGLRKNYIGEKFVNGKSSGMAFGTDWKMFFVHFTALGLTDGEKCEMEDVTAVGSEQKTQEYLEKRRKLQEELVKVSKKILAYKPKKKPKKKPKLADFEVVVPHEDGTYFL